MFPLTASPTAHPGGARRRGAAEGPESSADKTRIKELERENKELRTASEILKKASACFARAELDRPLRRRSLSSKSIATPAESSRPAAS